MHSSLFLVFFLAAFASGNHIANNGFHNQQCQINGGLNLLQCRLRTLQDGLQQDIDIEAVTELRVLCADLLPLESTLKSQHFGNLPSLRSLSLEYCKISQVPSRAFNGLTGLKSLSLQTHNSEWSSMLLEVGEDSFSHLESLEELNLSFNNLWSLPEQTLCNLPSLQTVNLSRNHLLDVSDIGLTSSGNGCQMPILNLDLSHNSIGSLQSGDLKRASSLQKLDLSNNRLSILGDAALSPSLRQLNLGNNQLAALPPTIFNESNALEELNLQNNSLTLLPTGLFSGLNRLLVLNLSRNAISSHLLSKETFSGLESLQVLDLSHNDLSKIESDAFEGLPQLQVIHLHGNKIHTIKDGSFSKQSLLQMLTLSHNRIEIITDAALNGLESLTSLSLDNNKLGSISLKADSHPQLKDLALNQNQLLAIPAFISSMTELKTLDLGDNAISAISADDFNGLNQLYGLRLAGNELTRVDNGTFSGASSIHILNLAHNQLEVMEGASMTDLKELRALRLDNNRLEDINGLVSSLGKLQWFNVSSNQLQWFDYAFIPNALEWLDMSSNNVAELGNFYDLDNFGILTLHAAFNSIKKISPSSFPTSLQHVDLRGNEVEEVEPFSFEQLRELRTVDLSENNIESLFKDALRVQAPNDRPEFSFLGNPLSCDCHMDWLPSVNDDLASASMARVVDLYELSCLLPTTGEVVSVPSVLPSQFLCQYQAHCSAQCMCCDFYACDCRFQCPEGCNCFHDQDWSQNVVMCAEKGHKHVPILIPLDATTVSLDGNNLRHIDTQSFLGRDNVRELFLNGSNIVSMSNNTFSGLSSLETLHLQDNNIREIRGYEFTALSLLQELYLHNNDLVYINEISFEPLRNLRTLRLDGNLLTVFPVWKLRANLYMSSLSLSRNTWSCECDFILPFNDFLEDRALSIIDYDAIQCVSDNMIDESGGSRVLCPKSTSLLRRQNERQNRNNFSSVGGDFQLDLLPILIPAVVAVAVLIIGFLAVFVFRKRIKSWLYNKSSEIYDQRNGSSGVSINSKYSSESKLFDVYITYSAKNREFVDQTLAPTLEHGACSYRLCLQQRDFPDNATIYTSVTEATVSSARVLVVLSRAYLDTEWAHVRVPLKAAIGRDANKIVFLLTEDLSDVDLMPYPELVHYLRICGSVRWGSSACISHLRCLLPEPAFMTFQRNITLRHQQRAIPTISQLPLPPQPPPTYTEANMYGQYALRGCRPVSEHTYQSIPETHIYHTLEPSHLLMAAPLSKPSPLHPQQFYHAHSQSTSSGTQLLAPQSAGQEEYIV